MMRVSALILAGSFSATAAHAQLMSERVDGGVRLCRYAPTGLAAPRQVTTGNGADLEHGRRLDAHLHECGE